MLLSEPQSTPYDLHFRLFGIPVRIHPMFWLFGVIFGWRHTQEPDGMVRLLVFLGCMLLSLLVHEMGHVLMGRVFGARSHIILYAMGGLAVSDVRLPGRWQRILVSAAGPVAGF